MWRQRFADPCKEVARILGYEFLELNLLRDALGKRSGRVSIKRDHERLEFLGDRVVNTFVSEQLWTRCPGVPVNKLHHTYKRYVSNLHLGRTARALGFDRCLIDTLTRTPSIYTLACTFEAVIGAVFIDCGHSYPTIARILDRILPLNLPRPIKEKPLTASIVISTTHRAQKVRRTGRRKAKKKRRTTQVISRGQLHPILNDTVVEDFAPTLSTARDVVEFWIKGRVGAKPLFQQRKDHRTNGNVVVDVIVKVHKRRHTIGVGQGPTVYDAIEDASLNLTRKSEEICRKLDQLIG